jgi:hypothetical protein
MVLRLDPKDCHCPTCGGGVRAPEGYFGGSYCPCPCHALTGREREAYMERWQGEAKSAFERALEGMQVKAVNPQPARRKAMPIYMVTTTIEGEKLVEKVRLVRAQNKMQALSHAAERHITVGLASEDDLIKLTKDGVNVETVDAAKKAAA